MFLCVTCIITVTFPPALTRDTSLPSARAISSGASRCTMPRAFSPVQPSLKWPKNSKKELDIRGLNILMVFLWMPGWMGTCMLP